MCHVVRKIVVSLAFKLIALSTTLEIFRKTALICVLKTMSQEEVIHIHLNGQAFHITASPIDLHWNSISYLIHVKSSALRLIQSFNLLKRHD